MSYARESLSEAKNRPAWQVPFSLAHFWHHHRRLSGIVTTTPKRGESLEIILFFDPALHPELSQDRRRRPVVCGRQGVPLCLSAITSGKDPGGKRPGSGFTQKPCGS